MFYKDFIVPFWKETFYKNSLYMGNELLSTERMMETQKGNIVIKEFYWRSIKGWCQLKSQSLNDKIG